MRKKSFTVFFFKKIRFFLEGMGNAEPLVLFKFFYSCRAMYIWPTNDICRYNKKYINFTFQPEVLFYEFRKFICNKCDRRFQSRDEYITANLPVTLMQLLNIRTSRVLTQNQRKLYFPLFQIFSVHAQSMRSICAKFKWNYISGKGDIVVPTRRIYQL